VDNTLRPSNDVTGEETAARLIALREDGQARADPVEPHVAQLRSSCEPGVCVGGALADVPGDHVDLARWGKYPKGHERRLHGRRHVGVRLVRQGPTLMCVLDAHLHHDGPWTVDDLEPYRDARVPVSPQEAVERGKIMRQARSRKKRKGLRADLEKRYLSLS
jgi:hypothetical protein